MISHNHRFVFVHINKTGGTSIEKVFDPEADQRDVELKHASAAYYQENFPQDFLNYFKFAFVRNPWDWLVSRYFWSRDHQRLFDFSFGEMVWRLEHQIQLSPAAAWLERGALRTQVERLSIGGAIAMDFVGRFESLQHDFNDVCQRQQIAATPLPHVFKTHHAPYTDYYDDRTRRRVERLYAADIAAFGYRFGDDCSGRSPHHRGTGAD
jgi:hypothetical protein